MKLRTPELVAPPEDVPQVRADLGNLLLAFVMLWTYFSLSQFLIIWSGNLPEEATWYVARSEGGWQWLSVAIVVLAFVAPFAALLSYDVKRNPAALTFVAGLIIFAQLLHWLWMLGPIYYGERLFVHWADLAAIAAVKGILMAVLLWRLERLPRLGPPTPTHKMSSAHEGTIHA
jgi:hypothetical protein